MDVQEEREGKELVLLPIPIPIRFGEVSQGLRVSGSFRVFRVFRVFGVQISWRDTRTSTDLTRCLR